MNKVNEPIVILTKIISRRTGGSSSILDICETLYSLGYNVHIGMTISNKLLYLLKDKKNASTTIPISNIHTVPTFISGYFLNENKGEEYNLHKFQIKKIIHKATRIISLLLFKNHFIQVLGKSKIIICGVPFLTGGMEEIKKHTKAKIILNHPGSLDTFEQYWINEKNKPLVYDDKLSLYVNYCKQFDKILFQAEDQAQECRDKHKGLINLPIVIKPTCDEKVVLRSINSKNPYTNEIFNIVNVGSIQPRKAQDLSVKAFSEFLKNHKNINSKLHFVGSILDYDFYSTLKKNILFEGLESKVIFHYHRQDYLNYIAHSDVLLQTSKSEGVSRVLREAMLLRVPIVSFNISGTKDILSSEDNEALLAEPFNTQKIASALEDLHSKELAVSTTNNAFNKYLRFYSSVVYANSWLNCINNTL